jgi:hypothetical protein
MDTSWLENSKHQRFHLVVTSHIANIALTRTLTRTDKGLNIA